MNGYLLLLFLSPSVLQVPAGDGPAGTAGLALDLEAVGPVTPWPLPCSVRTWPAAAVWGQERLLEGPGRSDWRIPAGERLEVRIELPCGAGLGSFLGPIPAGGAVELRLELPGDPPGAAEQTVFATGLDGQPLAGVEVSLAASCQLPLPGPWQTDTQGRAVFTPGPCACLHGQGLPLRVQALGFASRVVMLDPLGSTVATIRLEPGRSVTAQVADDQGRPAAGCVVEAFLAGADAADSEPTSPAPLLSGSVWTIGTARCDDLGWFEMPGLSPSRTYQWRFRAADGSCAVRSGASPAPEGEPVVLCRPEPVFGRVVDELGEPVAGAWIQARFPTTRKGAPASTGGIDFQVRSDADGRFRIPPEGHPEWGAGLPSGPIRLSAGSSSLLFDPACGLEEGVLVVPGGAAGHSSAAAAGWSPGTKRAVVGGEVRDASGSRVGILRSALIREGPSGEFPSNCGATDGSFLQLVPEPGRFRFAAVLADGRQAWSEPFEVRGGEEVWLSLEPRAGGFPPSAFPGSPPWAAKTKR